MDRLTGLARHTAETLIMDTAELLPLADGVYCVCFNFPDIGRNNVRAAAARPIRRTLASLFAADERQVTITHTHYGRPFVPGHHWYVSISYSSKAAVLAVSNEGAVGIDIEDTARVNAAREAAELFFTAEERTGEPLIFWTAKESFVKTIGLGACYDMSSCTFRQRGASAELIAAEGFNPDEFRFVSHWKPDAVITLCRRIIP
ncbi:MAG: 4'-phosphopantetheinyl transferase superfamily protein [Spirochaetes bacterium]|nr:4'-phosphopantetheinyl transferase superfamily protein [Spirochaetota bacterium]